MRKTPSHHEQHRLARRGRGHRRRNPLISRSALIAALRRVARGHLSRRPLDIAIRGARAVVERLEETPLKATPAQQILLGVAAAQLRAAAGKVIVSSERDRAESVETALGDLISRTLALVDAATAAGQPALTSPGEGASTPPSALTAPVREIGMGAQSGVMDTSS